MRLIDADEIEYELAFREFYLKAKWEEQPMVWKTEIDQMPTVDAEPVRHGKWRDLETFKRPWFRHHIFECSACGNTLDMDGVNAGRGDANYCPNCGAKMGERKEYETD